MYVLLRGHLKSFMAAEATPWTALATAVLVLATRCATADEPPAPPAEPAPANAKTEQLLKPIPNAAQPLSPALSEEETARIAEIAKEVGELWQNGPRTPLPADSTSPSAQEHTRRYNAWIESLYLDAWRDHGKHDARWDDRVEALLKDYVLPTTPLGSREIVARTRKLMATGCDDVLLRFIVAHSYDLNAGMAHYKAINLLRPKIEKLDVEYTAPVAYRMEMWYVEAWNRGYRTKFRQVAPIAERMIDRIIKMISVPLTDQERRFHLKRLTNDIDGTLGRYLELFFKKLAAAPNADRWLVQMLLARAHFNLGWKARGGGWASEVTDKGWQGFDAHLTKARSLLLQAWKERPNLPEAARDQITITMAIGGAAGEDCRFWLDRAVKVDFDVPDIYRRFLWAIRPRWGGSHAEMLRFGRECLATQRFDTDVPWVFHHALCNVLSEVDEPRKVCETLDVYEDYLVLLAGKRPQIEDDAIRRQLDASHACVAWLTGHDDEARRLLERLGDDVPVHSIAAFHTTLSDIRVALAGEQRAPPGKRWAAGDIERIRFASQTGRLVGFGARSGLQAWDMTDGCRVDFELPTKVDGRLIRDVDISPDGKLLAMVLMEEGNELRTGWVVLWDVATAKLLRTLSLGKGGPAYRLRFSPDGKRVAAGKLDGHITIWDVETGKRPNWGIWPAHPPSWVEALAFTSDGKRLATAGGDWNVTLWELPETDDQPMQPLAAKATWGPFDSMPRSLSFSPDGQRLLIGHNYCDVWDVTTGKPLHRLPGARVSFSPDGQTLATGGGELDSEARIWDAKTYQQRARLIGGHQHSLLTLAYCQNGQRVLTGSAGGADPAGQREGALRCWDVKTGDEVADFSDCR